ncbi:4Fe-4S dicluster domain-containing protein [Pusillimonas noertemannii]|uniref:4Fe-4S dicluster domain-containing protein n=1 Tax=Pusillimonas noertemannii TaxID=305977 RepID=UPI003341EB3D
MRRLVAPTASTAAAIGVDGGRRRVLKLMAASAALAGSGCGQPPPEKIRPYVNMPEGMAPGDPVFYASTLLRQGCGVGVLVETESGRPIKIEGNPAHPASLGAADAQSQAAILTLWDPERSRTVMRGGQPSTWTTLLDSLATQMGQEAAARGGGLRLLSGPVSSPTLLAQIGEILARFPEARWHVHDPAGCDAAKHAALQLFGGPVQPLYRLEHAHTVLSLDAELFGPSADGLRNAHDFMNARRGEPRARMYALESTPGLCGAVADTRIALSPAGMEAVLDMIASQLGVSDAMAEQRPGPQAAWVSRLCTRLSAAHGASAVIPGHSLSSRAHLLAWRINTRLGNLGRTIHPIAQRLPPAPLADGTHDAAPAPEGLGALVQAMHDGDVQTLLMLDVNPVYDSPGALDFARGLSRVACSIHMGLYRDETAHASNWHIPMAHELEAWSDARSFDGTASLVQPVIAPLYGGLSAHEVLDMLAHMRTRSAHELVRAQWRNAWNMNDAEEFERRWEEALRRGVIEEAQADRLVPIDEKALKARLPEGPGPEPQLIAVFANDHNIVSCNQANNAWLQELPRPYTKITWDNAALIGPATAGRHGLRNGDVVSLTSADKPDGLLAPVWIVPGQAEGVVTLPLGYGRHQGGSVAQGRGFDAHVLQEVRNGMSLRSAAVQLRPTGQHHAFAATQHEMGLAGREPVRSVSLHARDGADAADAAPPSLYPPRQYGGPAWGMTVDLDACIGCNACAIACQAENNIPSVGPEEVARGREMHWMRIDVYHADSGGRAQFQPMACQHCENAPCEIVCPVGATMHDSEGLNVQVYNRCVGTRFCSNNCPYKVRRFNFFDYADHDPSAAARANPDVTVRQRGVMEKCTYCVQRISHARIEAQKQGRPLRDGDVVTACEATCPTQAIVFGDTADPRSRVSRAKASARNYTVLAELNTRPRTSYLARIHDKEAGLEEEDDG